MLIKKTEQADAKSFTQVKNTETVIFKSKQKKFEGDLKIQLMLKTISCWLIQISVKQLGVKIYANLAGNIMLMISPLNWREPIISSSKEENELVLLKIIKTHLHNMLFWILLILWLSCLGSEFPHYGNSMDCKFWYQSLFKQ